MILDVRAWPDDWEEQERLRQKYKTLRVYVNGTEVKGVQCLDTGTGADDGYVISLMALQGADSEVIRRIRAIKPESDAKATDEQFSLMKFIADPAWLPLLPADWEILGESRDEPLRRVFRGVVTIEGVVD